MKIRPGASKEYQQLDPRMNLARQIPPPSLFAFLRVHSRFLFPDPFPDFEPPINANGRQ